MNPAEAMDEARLCNDLAAELEGSDERLPLLPAVAAEILGLARDPDAPPARLAELLHRDPALAGNVLRIANSPAYLPATRIVSLQQAVTRLGFATLGEIALAASLQSGVFSLRGYGTVLDELWSHSVATAGFAREIARLRRRNTEAAFLSGLLHAIGKPVVLQALADHPDAAAGDLPPSIVHRTLEALHAPVGLRLVEAWNLPEFVAVAIADPDPAGTDEPPPELRCVVSLGSAFAAELLDEGTDEDELKASPDARALDLYVEDVEALLEHREAIRELVRSVRA